MTLDSVNSFIELLDHSQITQLFDFFGIISDKSAVNLQKFAAYHGLTIETLKLALQHKNVAVGIENHRLGQECKLQYFLKTVGANECHWRDSDDSQIIISDEIKSAYFQSVESPYTIRTESDLITFQFMKCAIDLKIKELHARGKKKDLLHIIYTIVLMNWDGPNIVIVRDEDFLNRDLKVLGDFGTAFRKYEKLTYNEFRAKNLDPFFVSMSSYIKKNKDVGFKVKWKNGITTKVNVEDLLSYRISRFCEKHNCRDLEEYKLHIKSESNNQSEISSRIDSTVYKIPPSHILNFKKLKPAVSPNLSLDVSEIVSNASDRNDKDSVSSKDEIAAIDTQKPAFNLLEIGSKANIDNGLNKVKSVLDLTVPRKRTGPSAQSSREPQKKTRVENSIKPSKEYKDPPKDISHILVDVETATKIRKKKIQPEPINITNPSVKKFGLDAILKPIKNLPKLQADISENPLAKSSADSEASRSLTDMTETAKNLGGNTTRINEQTSQPLSKSTVTSPLNDPNQNNVSLIKTSHKSLQKKNLPLHDKSEKLEKNNAESIEWKKIASDPIQISNQPKKSQNVGFIVMTSEAPTTFPINEAPNLSMEPSDVEKTKSVDVEKVASKMTNPTLLEIRCRLNQENNHARIEKIRSRFSDSDKQKIKKPVPDPIINKIENLETKKVQKSYLNKTNVKSENSESLHAIDILKKKMEETHHNNNPAPEVRESNSPETPELGEEYLKVATPLTPETVEVKEVPEISLPHYQQVRIYLQKYNEEKNDVKTFFTTNISLDELSKIPIEFHELFLDSMIDTGDIRDLKPIVSLKLSRKKIPEEFYTRSELKQIVGVQESYLFTLNRDHSSNLFYINFFEANVTKSDFVEDVYKSKVIVEEYDIYDANIWKQEYLSRTVFLPIYTKLISAHSLCSPRQLRYGQVSVIGFGTEFDILREYLKGFPSSVTGTSLMIVPKSGFFQHFVHFANPFLFSDVFLLFYLEQMWHIEDTKPLLFFHSSSVVEQSNFRVTSFSYLEGHSKFSAEYCGIYTVCLSNFAKCAYIVTNEDSAIFEYKYFKRTSIEDIPIEFINK
eukprot:NODE_13_length_54415_cov_0.522424.p1 type:complete len:1069 gc:universal NODE_13_length_54415_cov_0.522424:2504-5710(+)